jgi:quinol-cytochrome oxidoreductase complex cytochrome b subunit
MTYGVSLFVIVAMVVVHLVYLHEEGGNNAIRGEE